MIFLVSMALYHSQEYFSLPSTSFVNNQFFFQCFNSLDLHTMQMLLTLGNASI